MELAPALKALKMNEVHPVYKLQYLLYRRVSVEEPHQINGPVQCTNCQDFGHIRSYCTLLPVCEACGEFHGSAESKLKKTGPQQQNE